MSAVVLFHDSKPLVGALELDATLTETHAGDVEVTEHPVERGANIVDHFRLKPVQLTIEGFVTNTPVSADARSRVGAVSRGDAGQAGRAYELLLEMRESEELVTIATRMRSYSNMKLTSLSVPRDRSTGDALRFTASFREIVLVSSERVEVPAEYRGQKKRSSGPAQPKPANDEESRSTLDAVLFGSADEEEKKKAAEAKERSKKMKAMFRAKSR